MLHDGDIAILRGAEVRSLLTGRELDVIQAVRMAYETHGGGDSSLPHSNFLRFPGQPQDRIIALPAYLGGECRIAGIKWVSSFPDNLHLGVDRASAVVILNSPQTGRPEAVLEGSVISAKRTAASAALAAQCLVSGNQVGRVGMIGCGLINFEIARFLLGVFPEVETFVLFDKDETRAKQFQNKFQKTFNKVEVETAKDAKNGSETISVFSPFGLGILDLAVAKLVRDLALQQGLETVIGSFLPSSWAEQA